MTKAEFIQLKQLEKAVKDYDFLDSGIHNGFTYPTCAIAIATDDRRDFELVQAQWGYVPGNMTWRKPFYQSKRPAFNVG